MWYHFDLLAGYEVGEVELFDEGGGGVEPFHDECVFSFGHVSYILLEICCNYGGMRYYLIFKVFEVVNQM